MKKLGKFIADKRRQRGLTLRDMEGITGLSNSYLSQLEMGNKAHLPNPKALHAIARALGVEVRALITEAGYFDPQEQAESLEEQIERRFRHALTDTRFQFGRMVKGDCDFNLKRFVVEMWDAT